jgi:hypothetical protein
MGRVGGAEVVVLEAARVPYCGNSYFGQQGTGVTPAAAFAILSP